MVDILLATYNGATYLKSQIDSLLNQTYGDIRILIRDDGSTDETTAIIEEYTKIYPQKIIYILDNDLCRDSTKNFFRLLECASSEYAMFCDQDDFWVENKIENMLKIMKMHEKNDGFPVLVYSDMKVVDENLLEIKGNNMDISRKSSLNRLLVDNYIPGCVMMMNRSLYSVLGDYDERICIHDWWVVLVASSIGRTVYIPEKLTFYRQHSNNVIGAVSTKSFEYLKRSLKSGKMKKAQYSYKKQIELLLERYNERLSNDARESLNKFVEIFDYKFKIQRIFFLIRGRYFKRGIFRIIGQVVSI